MALDQLNIDKSPKRWATFQDILKVQPDLIIIATPWSQPAWMKGTSGGSLHVGSVPEKYEEAFADYLGKFVKELKERKGIRVNRLSLQNEPLYDQAPFPCTKMQTLQQARIGDLTRARLDEVEPFFPS